MNHTELEKFIQAELIKEGWEPNQFGVISTYIEGGGSCNLTYVIADIIRAYNKSLIESLGDTSENNEYELSTDNHKRWWLTHKTTDVGELFERFLNSEPINK